MRWQHISSTFLFFRTILIFCFPLQWTRVQSMARAITGESNLRVPPRVEAGEKSTFWFGVQSFSGSFCFPWFYFIFFFLFNFWQKQKELGALCKRHLVHKWLQRSNQFMEKRILCHRKNSCKWKRKRISWLGNEGARSFLFTKQNQTKSEASVRKAHELFNNRRTRDVMLFHWMQTSYWILHKIN